MFHVIPREEPAAVPPIAPSCFEGGDYGAPVSIFLIDNEPGQGPDLHVHPYTEMWIVRSGKARFTVGEETLEPNVGDIVIVNAETPHCFQECRNNAAGAHLHPCAAPKSFRAGCDAVYSGRAYSEAVGYQAHRPSPVRSRPAGPERQRCACR